MPLTTLFELLLFPGGISFSSFRPVFCCLLRFFLNTVVFLPVYMSITR